MLDRPSVWGHTLAAEEIMMPKIVVKGKGNRRGKSRGRRRKENEKTTENRKHKPQPIIRHQDKIAYKQEIKCQVHSKASANLVGYEDSYIITCKEKTKWELLHDRLKL